MESDTGISTKCFNNIILLTDSMGIGGLCGLHYENLSSWIDFRRSSMVIPIPKTHSLRGPALRIVLGDICEMARCDISDSHDQQISARKKDEIR